MIDSQARSLLLEDLKSNFLVEASAGSGKTHSLVGRLVSGFRQGVYVVEQVAVVTFTRKAAAELSGRLRLALEAEGSPETQRALANFEQMFVGTVHSFCARLLRRYPVQAGISPGFTELEEAADLLLLRRVLRASLEQPEGRRLLKLLREFEAGTPELLKALRLMSDYGELEYAHSEVQPPPLDPAWEQIDEFAAFLGESLPECAEPQPSCKLLVLGPSLLRRCRSARRDSPHDLVMLLEEWETEPKPIKRYWGGNRAEQNERLEPVLERVARFRQNVVGPDLARWRSYLYSQCLPFLLQVRTAAQEERKLSGAVNFNDLLRLTCALVRTHSAARGGLKHLCVDEFQDTDPLQAELFFLLASQDPHEQDWRRTWPRPASLFLVGDPKQSIYRFRRADIETYNTVRRRIQETGGQVLSLVTSFRSTPPLCQWLNLVFSALLPAEPTPQQARFQPLGWPERRGCPPPVGRLISSPTRHSEVSELEATQIAGLIQARLSQGYQASDFLILTARKAELFHYQEALSMAGIPCQLSADPVPLTATGRAVLRLLQVLDRPQDSIALVGVLRGLLFGHSDPELFQQFQGNSETPVASSLRLLHELRQQISSLAPGAAARVVCQALGLESTPELEGLTDSLRVRAQAGLTLAQAVLEVMEENAVPLPPQRGALDGVRVMNLHKAKGLEARVVFLAAPTSGLPLQAVHAVFREQGQARGALCLYRHRNRKPLAHPPDWDSLEQAELDYLRAEQVRLLYVAATRAREQLIVGQWTGTHASVSQPWADLAPFLDEEPLPHHEAVPATATLPRRQDPLASLEPCLAPSFSRHAVSSNNQTRALGSLKPPEGFSAGGAAWGDLIHRLLEQLVLRPELQTPQLRSLARWFSFEAPEVQDHLEAALDTLERVRQSTFWQRVLGARQRLVEVPFGQRVDRRLLFGIIDLALEQEQGWDIIDYKTDRKRLDDLVATYADQVARYAQSWNEITQEEVGFAGIYSVREGQLTEDIRPSNS